jgi:hypothetical protein
MKEDDVNVGRRQPLKGNDIERFYGHGPRA